MNSKIKEDGVCWVGEESKSASRRRESRREVGRVRVRERKEREMVGRRGSR